MLNILAVSYHSGRGKILAGADAVLAVRGRRRCRSFAAMKKILFLGTCLVALAAQPVMAQTVARKADAIASGVAQNSGPEVVVVRVYDNVGAGQLRLAITHADGKSESVDMPGGGASDKKLMESSQSFQHLFAKLYQEGYTLKSTFSGTEGTTATLVFVKGQ